MAAGAIRGSRVGSGPMGEDERGQSAPRRAVTYFCTRDHETVLNFSMAADIPDLWDCQRCGLPAGVNSEERPPPEVTAPFKTHLAYAKERRSEDEAKVILREALVTLRAKRKSGEIIF